MQDKHDEMTRRKRRHKTKEEWRRGGRKMTHPGRKKGGKRNKKMNNELLNFSNANIIKLGTQSRPESHIPGAGSLNSARIQSYTREPN